MNTYPYIGQINGATKVLFTTEKGGFHLDSHTLAPFDFSVGWNEDDSINITAEYLANTYGEVKSKEHAEFIKLLAETNDIPCSHHIIDGCFKYFYFTNEVLFFTTSKVPLLTDCKQITIPLPPEYGDDEWPKVGDAVFVGCTKGYVVSLPDGDESYAIATPKNADFIFAKRIELSKEPKIQSFNEWPEVDDEVLLGSKKGIVKLPPDSQGYYVVAVDGIYTQCKFGELSKPKTPEQELRDEQIKEMSQQIRNRLVRMSWDEAEVLCADLYELGYRKPQ